MPRKRTGRKWCTSSRPQWATSQRNVTRDCVLIGKRPYSGGRLRENFPGIATSPISLLSMGGVCGRSLTAGKILFTGRQTCSLYLVLWLRDLTWYDFNFKSVHIYQSKQSLVILGSTGIYYFFFSRNNKQSRSFHLFSP